MTSKQRLLCALSRGKPDRLPVTIHQWQPYHLKKYMNGMSDIEAFAACGLDASINYFEVTQPESADWRVSASQSKAGDIIITDWQVVTPEGELTWQEGANAMTTWIKEPMIKHEDDIFLLKYMPLPILDRKGAVDKYDALGDNGILRTFLCGIQGGCWQDACELFGADNLILAAFENPDWVHEFLKILLARKLQYIQENLRGMPFDLVETGGGASSNTLISPAFHEAFCLPYDQKIHNALRDEKLCVVYHTCGGMSKITRLIRENRCHVSETLSPSSMGGDICNDDVARQVYDDLHPYLALIGGMDQFHILEKGNAVAIKQEVARLFMLYGQNGGYVLSASDHFFEAPPENLRAFAEAAYECTY